MSSDTNSWNPEKSPRQEDDLLLVPGTMYSRRWLVRLIGQLAKLVGLHVPEQIETDADIDLEQELCDLWDASTNEGVADTLIRLNAHQLFVYFSSNPECLSPVTENDRAMEISLGILANMCCFEANREPLRPFVADLLSIHATTQCVEVLTQLYRLVSCLLHQCDPESMVTFLRERVLYTLNNCLNEELLTNACTLFRQLVDNFAEHLNPDAGIVSAAETALEALHWATEPSANLLNGLITMCSYLPETVDIRLSLSSIVINGLKTDEQANLAATFLEAVCSDRPELLDFACLIDEAHIRTVPSLMKVMVEQPRLLRALDADRRRKLYSLVNRLLKESLTIEDEKP